MNKYLIFLFILISVNCLRAYDFRSAAMGGTGLVLNHPANALNLFHAAGNTAYLMQAEPSGWLKLYGMNTREEGDFRRFYDPGSANDISLFAEGVKIMDANQAFWGAVNYSFRRLGDIAYALEPQPYANDPLLIADTTVGDFKYDGPRIAAGYQYRFSRRFSMGAEINYEISQGVKRQYSRARILRRDFVAKVAATLDLGKNLVLGGFLAFNDLQDQIELQGTAIDAEDPLVKEYRSESVFSYKIGSFNHWEKTRDYRANLALQKSNREDTRVQLLQLNYRSSKLHSFDQTLIKSPFADWFCDSWSGEYEGRWFDPEEKWNLGLRGGLSHLSSFTRHPEFDVLITERAVTSGYAEAGISRKFVIWKPVLVTLQGGFSRTGDKYDDYQSQIFRDLTQNRYSAKLGLEWKLNSAHRLLLGYNYGDVQVDVFSPRYLPDHILHKITLGYSETRPDYNWAVQFEYSDKMAQNSGSDYRVWRVVLFTQIMGQGK